MKSNVESMTLIMLWLINYHKEMYESRREKKK